jgi:hypothetical protein
MVSRSGPIRARLRRLAIAGGLVVAVMAAAPAVASATPPTSFTFDTSGSGTDPDVCAAYGFVVNNYDHMYGTVRSYYSGGGTFTGFTAFVNNDVTISANGKTLYERDRFVFFYNADGSSRSIGLETHIQGPGGIVLLDAGRLVFAPDGTVVAVDGPHPQFFGATFCGALAP